MLPLKRAPGLDVFRRHNGKCLIQVRRHQAQQDLPEIVAIVTIIIGFVPVFTLDIDIGIQIMSV